MVFSFSEYYTLFSNNFLFSVALFANVHQFFTIFPKTLSIIFQDIYIIIECSVTLNLQILLSNAHYDYSELPAQKN